MALTIQTRLLNAEPLYRRNVCTGLLYSRTLCSLVCFSCLLWCCVFDEVWWEKEMWSFFARDPVKDFAYEILQDTQEKSGIWTLHRGKRKVKGFISAGPH